MNNNNNNDNNNHNNNNNKTKKKKKNLQIWETHNNLLQFMNFHQSGKSRFAASCDYLDN